MSTIKLDGSQEAAATLATKERSLVITGGPGTGKTTTMLEILNRFDAMGISYALAAPTGKAARRMQETTGREARTIHRLLGYQMDGWAYNKNNPLPYDRILVDEFSMCDTELGADLMDALRPDAGVVFVGDAAQLPSVGPGRVLADLVESGVIPVARLSTVHRSAQESWICRNAPRVLTGEKLELDDFPDFHWVQTDNAADCQAQVVRLMKMEEYRNAQVLTPQRTTACGVDLLNPALQKALNPAEALKPEWKIGDRFFRKGDKVIQTSNDYDLNVFNGEVGYVVRFNDEAGVMVVDFGDRTVAYGKQDAMSLDLAYALTVHKSQGSEFPWVIVVVHSAHTHMLQRNLFYTAITRAKKGVVMVGDRKGLRAATEPKDPPRRNTALVSLIREALGESAPETEEQQEQEKKPPARRAAPAPIPMDPRAAAGTDDIAW